jgi:hypothetical protein
MKKITLVLGWTILALTAQGGTIVFNTLGPGDTYSLSSGFFLETGQMSSYAAQFVAGASGRLTTIELGLTYEDITPDRPGPVNVYLYGDAAGVPDIANKTFLGITGPTTRLGVTDNNPVTLGVVGDVSVLTGSTYWLALELAPRFDEFLTFDVWNSSLSTPLPAFRIEVPDTGTTFYLFGLSLAGLAFLRRKILA